MPDVTRTVTQADIVTAVAYCRIGGPRPVSDEAFQEAKGQGLLAQDSVWRATERGVGALIAAGLMKGEPAPRRQALIVLWAACERYPEPQFVTAWSAGLDECYPEEAERLRSEAETWWQQWGDEGGWEFWTEHTHMNRPSGVPVREADDE